MRIREGGRAESEEDRNRGRETEREKDRPERRQIGRKKGRKEKEGKKGESSGLRFKGWHCIIVAMVTESQNSKCSRTANRRPHPAQPNLHPSAGTAHCHAPHHISTISGKYNDLNAFCRDTVFLQPL